ncbi:hypothetical protein Tco_1051504 [Tanacetum coccineum]
MKNLIECLGTIAQRGTPEFLNAPKWQEFFVVLASRLPKDSKNKVDFKRTVQLQLLQKLKLVGTKGLNSQACLMKYMVQRSPLLKEDGYLCRLIGSGDTCNRHVLTEGFPPACVKGRVPLPSGLDPT